MKTTDYIITFNTGGVWRGSTLSFREALLHALSEQARRGLNDSIDSALRLNSLTGQWDAQEIPATLTIYR